MTSDKSVLPPRCFFPWIQCKIYSRKIPVMNFYHRFWLHTHTTCAVKRLVLPNFPCEKASSLCHLPSLFHDPVPSPSQYHLLLLSSDIPNPFSDILSPTHAPILSLPQQQRQNLSVFPLFCSTSLSLLFWLFPLFSYWDTHTKCLHVLWHA